MTSATVTQESVARPLKTGTLDIRGTIFAILMLLALLFSLAVLARADRIAARAMACRSSPNVASTS